MLPNPFTTKWRTIPGTPLLEDALGLAGFGFYDPLEPYRFWTIQWLLAPVPGRRLPGIRAKLCDQKGFVSFCNQRDLDVLLGYAQPGQRCLWTRDAYPAPHEDDWYGVCADASDLRDDLYERELRLRAGSLDPLPRMELTRRVHLDRGNDAEELFLLLADVDRATGMSPDPRFETLEARWTRVERTRVQWEYYEHGKG